MKSSLRFQFLLPMLAAVLTAALGVIVCSKWFADRSARNATLNHFSSTSTLCARATYPLTDSVLSQIQELSSLRLAIVATNGNETIRLESRSSGFPPEEDHAWISGLVQKASNSNDKPNFEEVGLANGRGDRFNAIATLLSEQQKPLERSRYLVLLEPIADSSSGSVQAFVLPLATAAAAIKKLRPRLPVIMMTAFGDLSSAMEAMELDVFEYLTKPFDLADGLKAIAKAIASTSTPATKGVAESILNEALIGSSPAMQRVYKQVALASRSDVPVLISGPIGIDKEYVASTIHRNGPRQSSPFLAFVPTAISPIAVASEFLGSLQSPSSRAGGTFFRSGAVELAGDGTLYVDEVSDLPLSLQAQLLRVLEHKKYNRLGDATSRACSARVLVSTSRNLRTVVAEGEFLEELRQRLDVFTIELVALSERRDDILPLAVAFLKTHAADRELGFTEDAVKWLISGAWPGNVRELRSVIDRAVVSSRGRWIDVEDLADADGLLPSTLPGIATDLADAIRRWTLTHLDKLGEKDLRIQDTQSEDAFGCMYEDFLSTVERPMLQSMMEAFHHNRALIATQLGMHRSTLRQKMRRYEID